MNILENIQSLIAKVIKFVYNFNSNQIGNIVIEKKETINKLLHKNNAANIKINVNLM